MITYQGQFIDGIDLRYKVYDSFVKEEIIINSLEDLHNNIGNNRPRTDNLMFEIKIRAYQFANDSDMNMRIDGRRVNFRDLNQSESSANEIEFIDENNRSVYTFKKPYAYDQNDSLFLNYTFRVNPQGNLVIKVYTPYSWLNSSERAYPLVIDPTVTIVNVGSNGSLTNVTQENRFSHLNISDSNLLMYIPFDTNTSNTTFYDYTPNNNDATKGNKAWASTLSECNLLGGCHNQTSTTVGDVFTQVPSLTSTGSTNFSACVWVNPSATPSVLRDIIGTESTVGSQRGWVLRSSATGVFQFHTFNVSQTVSQGGLATGGVWQHLCGTYNWGTGQGTLYINGTQVDQDNHDAGGVNNSQNLFIGGTDNIARSWIGLIDEVMIFNRVLTSTEVNLIYQNSSTINRFLSRGEQIFNELNLSGTGSENRVNITLDAQTLLSSSFQIKIGDSGSGAYTYGETIECVNGQCNDAIVDTPNNSSLVVIFNPTPSSRFYTPVLQNNITLSSYVGSLYCRRLQEAGRTYTLTQDVNSVSTCFTVTADNITLDADGFRIILTATNSSAIGIDARNVNNFTLIDAQMVNWTTSIDTSGTETSTPNAGRLTVQGSNVSLLKANGLSDSLTISGGNGSQVKLTTSNSSEVQIIGGTPSTSLGALTGGNGGNLTLTNSRVTGIIDLSGGNGTSTIAPANGGNAGIMLGEGRVNLSSTTIRSEDGEGESGGANGNFGQIIINYTTSFDDRNAIYEDNLTLLRIINGSLNGGEIRFLPTIMPSGFSNLSTATSLRFNFAEVNTVSQPLINKSANITLYGTPSTGLTSPTLARNGVDCANSCYNFTSLTATNVIFNVSSWTNYSLIDNVTAQTLSRSVSQDLSLGESLEKSANIVRLISDSFIISLDSPVLKLLMRVISQDASISNSVEALKNLLREATQDMGISLFLERLTTISRETNLDISFSDTMLRILFASRETADTLNFGQDVQRTRIVPRSITDTLTFNDAVGRLQTLSRSVSQLLNFIISLFGVDTSAPEEPQEGVGSGKSEAPITGGVIGSADKTELAFKGGAIALLLMLFLMLAFISDTLRREKKIGRTLQIFFLVLLGGILTGLYFIIEKIII